MEKFVRGCEWVRDGLLVGIRKRQIRLSSGFAAKLGSAGITCVINLLSKEQFREAGPDTLFGSLGYFTDRRPPNAAPRINMVYSFWPSGENVPSSRLVRQALDEIDEALALGLPVFLHGADSPSRAALIAGCWIARHTESVADRNFAPTGDHPTAPVLGQNEKKRGALLAPDQRAFVRNWPQGPGAEPTLTVTELLDEDEVYPTATAEYWLTVLSSVRVYPDGRDGRCVVAPVVEQKTITASGIHLDLDALHSGTWIGERTLRLLDGTVVVFITSGRQS